ncbi:MAG: hypothetical protein H0W50_06525 [Parachlamydiaceae bacterium]|nr:hypothetical protein [Parachlamydiaceae bacterium]
MQPISLNLTVPDRSNFVGVASWAIDEKSMLNNNVQQENYKNLKNPEVVSYSTLLNNVRLLIPDCQSLILKETSGFQSWITAKMYCDDSAVEMYARKVLKDLNISHPLKKATEVFLRHKFNHLVQNSPKRDVDSILQEYYKENNPLEKTATKYQAIAQKVTSFAAIVLTIVGIPLALYGGYRLWACAHQVINFVKAEIVPIVVNKIINYTPLVVIRLATKIYDWRFTIFVTAFVARFTRLNNYSFIRIPLNALSELAYPSKVINRLYWLPSDIAIFSYNKIRNAASASANFVGEKSGIYARIQRSCDLKDAENLFVHQIMHLKVQAG